MNKRDITLNIIPAALAKLTEARETEALKCLAANSGMDLPTFMRGFGHHAVAKFLYEGRATRRNESSALSPGLVVLN